MLSHAVGYQHRTTIRDATNLAIQSRRFHILAAIWRCRHERVLGGSLPADDALNTRKPVIFVHDAAYMICTAAAAAVLHLYRYHRTPELRLGSLVVLLLSLLG